MILGLSPYRSPIDLWAEKVGKVQPEAPPEGSDQADRLAFGKAVERMLAKEYAKRTGRTIRRPPGQTAHPDRVWQRCHVDFYVADAGRGPGVVEIKSPGDWAAKAWREEPPATAQVQLQHNLSTTGRPWGSIVAWLGKGRLVWWDFELHGEFCEVLLRRESDFWGHVQAGTIPPLSMPEQDAKAIARLYATEGHEDEIKLPPEVQDWHDLVIEIKDEERKLYEQRLEFENRIKLAVGEHAAGRLLDGSRYRWKTIKRKGYTVAEKTYRDFRHVKR